MPLERREINGTTVLVDSTTGLVQLRDSAGRIVEQKPEFFQQDLSTGEVTLADENDVTNWDAANAPITEQVQTAGETVVRHGLDIGGGLFRDVAFGNSAAALGMGEKTRAEELLGGFTGAGAMGAAAYLAEGGGAEGARAEQELLQGMRERAERNPGSAMIGTGIAEVGAGLLLGRPMAGAGLIGEGSTWLSRAGAAALEGATVGPSMAAEEAFIANRELTSEATMAGVGLGALLSGGAMLGLEGIGYAGRKLWAFRKGAKAGSRISSALDEPLSVADIDSSLQAAAERANVGDVPEGFGAKMRQILMGEPGEATGETGARRAIYDVQSMSAGHTPEEAAAWRGRGPLTKTKEARDFRAAYRSREDIAENTTLRMMDDAENLRTSTQDITRETVERELKYDNVYRNLEDLTPEQRTIANDTAFSAINDAKKGISERVSELRRELYGEGDIPGLSRKTKAKLGEIGRLNDELGRIEAAAREAANAGDSAGVYIAADHYKRVIGRYTDNLNSVFDKIADPAKKRRAGEYLRTVRPAYTRLQEALEAPIWGKQGAAQKAVNAQWTEFINAQREFASEFLELDPGASRDFFTGIRGVRADQNKVYSFVKGVGTFQKRRALDAYKRYLNAAEGITAAHGEHYGMDQARQALVKDIGERVAGARKTLDDQVKLVSEINLFDAAKAKVFGEGVIPRSSAGALGGALVGGPIGAIAGGALGAVTDPARMWRITNALEANSGRTVSTIGQRGREVVASLAKLGAPLKKAAVTTGKVAARAGAAAARVQARDVARSSGMLAGFQREGESRREAYQKRLSELERFTGNPNAATAAMTVALAGASEHAPKLAANISLRASMAAAYLLRQAPTGTRKVDSFTPHLAKQTSASDQEIERFAQAWIGVNDPLSVLSDLEKGRISKEKVDAVKATYPELFKQMQQSILAGLRDLKEPLPYQGRVRLDLMFDLGGAAETSLSPAFLQRGAQAYAEHTAAAAADQQARAGRSGGTADFAADYQTTAQRIAQ